jgi:L-rhamnose mutarotase
MKNFKAEYSNLINSIIDEVISMLDNANLSELTLFEGHPWDDNNKGRKMAIFHEYQVYDEHCEEYIYKLVKCGGAWGFVVISTEIGNHKPQFPKELCARDMDFKCANTLYEIVFWLLNRKKTKGKSSLTELAGLAEVANN